MCKDQQETKIREVYPRVGRRQIVLDRRGRDCTKT